MTRFCPTVQPWQPSEAVERGSVPFADDKEAFALRVAFHVTRIIGLSKAVKRQHFLFKGELLVEAGLTTRQAAGGVTVRMIAIVFRLLMDVDERRKTKFTFRQ